MHPPNGCRRHLTISMKSHYIQFQTLQTLHISHRQSQIYLTLHSVNILIDFAKLFPVHKVRHVHKNLAGFVLKAFSFHCAL